MKKQAIAACVAVAYISAAVFSASADDVPGFLSETVVIAPGNGVSTNVTEKLSGRCNVQINDGATGGGIVTLANPYNNYYGGTYIKSGTLVVDGMEIWGSASPMGSASSVTNPIVLGNGTLHYTGPDATTDRSVQILMPSGAEKHAAVLELDNDLTLTGQFLAKNGSLIKTGPGTLTIATPATIEGCRNAFSGGVTGSINNRPDIGANGDGATTGFSGFTILNGRVVIDTPNTVTNNFGGDEFVVGKNSTSAAGAETAATLDIYGGYNTFGNFLAIGRANGNTTTAPDGISSTVNVYGGYSTANNVSMGYTINSKSVTAKPVLNVYGGELRASYLRLCDQPSQGYVTVNVTSGGILRSTGDYAAGQNAGGGTIYINISSNGQFVCGGDFNFFKQGSGNTDIVRIFDDGRLQANEFKCGGTGTARIEADGGVIRPSGPVNAKIVTVLGEKGLTIDARGDTTWYGTIQTQTGVESDGGLLISGGNTVKFSGALSFAGPIVCSDSSGIVFNGVVPPGPVCMLGTGALRCIDATTLPSVTNGASAMFGFTLDGSTVSTMTLNDWCPPGRLDAYFVTIGTSDPVATPGTYELLKFPASVPFTASQVRPFSTPAGVSYTYTVETSGDVKTLKITIAESSSAATSTWTNSAGGDWATGANWDGGSVPSSGASTIAAFTTAAQSGGATVTLGSAFEVGGVTVDSAEPYAFGGSGPLSISGPYAPAWSVLSGTHSVATHLSLSGLTAFDTVSGSALSVSGVVSGEGGVWANSGSAGCGTVTLAGANTFSGTFRQGNGTVVAPTLANAGTASSIGAGQGWTIGRGTFHYTGPDATIDRPLYIDTGDNYPARLTIDNDLTLTEPVTQLSGDLVKAGPGTLTLAGTGTNVIGNAYGASFLNNETKLVDWFDANGEPARFHCAFLVADGKVSWGVPGQVVRIPYDEVWIGSCTSTNAGQETTGELEITGGETYFPSYLVVGRNNGNPVSIGGDGIARPVVTIRDGYVNAKSIIMSYDNGIFNSSSRAYSTLNLLGGTLVVNNQFRMGNNNGGGSKATFNVTNGAHFLYRNIEDYNFRMGQGGVETELNISGSGTLFELETGNIELAYGNSTSTVNLSDGATIRSGNITRASGSGYLNWNGGTIQLVASEPWLAGFTQIRLGANQCVLDATRIQSGSLNLDSSTVSDPALDGVSDGGILVRGSEARAVFFRGIDGNTYTFTGPIVAESGSALGLSDVTLATQSILLQNGASLRVGGYTYTNNVANITFGENSGDVTRFLIHGYGGINYVKISDSITVNGTLEFNTYESGTNLYPVVGTYKLMSGPKGCFDTSKYAMDSRFPLFTATFEVVSLDADTDELVLTISHAASAVHTWQTNGGGSWSVADNWSSLPLDVAGDMVVFPSSLTEDAAVSLGGEQTLGAIASESQADVTLSGAALAMDNGPYLEPEISTVSGGSLTVPAFTSENKVNVNPADSGGGKVVLGGVVDAPALTVSSGTLQGAPASFGDTPVSLGPATLRFSESGVFSAKLNPAIASGEAMIVRADENAEVCIDKSFSNNGTFLKTGKGTLVLNGSGTIKLSGGNNNHSAELVMPENGDAPATGFPAAVIYNGKVVWGRDGQTVNVTGGEFWVGGNDLLNEDGTPMTGELEILGGKTTTTGYLVIGRSHASYEINSEPLRPTVTVRGGDVTVKQFIMAWDNASKMNLVATLNVHEGGIFRSNGRFALGNHGNGGHADTLEAVINQYGGEIHVSGGEYMSFGYAGGGAPSARATLNQYGGLTVVDGTNRKIVLGRYGARSRMNLHGGVVQANVISTGDWTSDSTAEIFWNGGCFRTSAAGQTIKDLTLNTVSTNGANVDLSLLAAGETLTWKSPFTHDEGLDGEDGGLTKTGAGTLVLAAANSLTGLVKIEEGEVLAQVDGAVAPGVEVAANAVLDGNAVSQTLARIKGVGTCSNGTFRVTQSVAPGADGHEAGACVTVTDLTMAPGASIVCTATDSGSACDLVKVTGDMVTEGVLTVDLGRDASNPLARTFEAKVAEIDGTVTLGGAMCGTGCGISGSVLSVRREGNGIWVKVIPGGTMMIVR